MQAKGLLSPVPQVTSVKVNVPVEHVLVLTLNRPGALNAVSPDLAQGVQEVLAWFDREPALWVAIVTGEGRAFCAGADLKAWRASQDAGDTREGERLAADPNGFASLSRRSISSKPIIAAVNGGAYGGGLEIVLNCDIVIASEHAQFALPEVMRSVYAAAGGIPRLAAIAGHQLASELLLTGRTITAQEAHSRFCFVNAVVPAAELLPTVIEWARRIAKNSPDAVMATKRALILVQQVGNYEHATIAAGHSLEARRLFTGENIKARLTAASSLPLNPGKNHGIFA